MLKFFGIIGLVLVSAATYLATYGAGPERQLPPEISLLEGFREEGYLPESRNLAEDERAHDAEVFQVPPGDEEVLAAALEEFAAMDMGGMNMGSMDMSGSDDGTMAGMDMSGSDDNTMEGMDMSGTDDNTMEGMDMSGTDDNTMAGMDMSGDGEAVLDMDMDGDGVMDMSSAAMGNMSGSDGNAMAGMDMSGTDDTAMAGMDMSGDGDTAMAGMDMSGDGEAVLDMDMNGDGVMDMSSAAMGNMSGSDGNTMAGMDMGAMEMADGGLAFSEDGAFDRVIDLTMAEWTYSDMQIDVKMGERIKFIVNNEGEIPHEFMFMTMPLMAAANYRGTRADWNLFEHEALFEKALILPGGEFEFVVEVQQAGSWMFMCMLPYHMQLGMMGQMATEGMSMDMEM